MGTIMKTDSANYAAIAGAIRAKLGVETLYKPGQMAAAIESIPSGAVDYAIIWAYWVPGNTITCAKGDTVYTSDTSGAGSFLVNSEGVWTLTDTFTGASATVTVAFYNTYYAEACVGLRTNKVTADIPLTNWTVNYSDDFDLIYKNAGTPVGYGNFKAFMRDSRRNDNFAIQYNFYTNRRCINVGWNGKWAGDAKIPYSSPEDLTNYYLIRKRGDVFSIRKLATIGGDWDGVAALAAEQEVTGASVDLASGYEAHLFDAVDSTLVMDCLLYALKIYDSQGTLLHNYQPYDNSGVVSLYDRVTDAIMTPSATGFTIE